MLAADAAQDAQSGDDVGGAVGDVADAVAVGRLAPLESGEDGPGDEADDEDADEDGQAEGDRGGEQQDADGDEADGAADERREGVDGFGDAADVGRADADDLPGGDLAAQFVAEVVDLAGGELEGSEGGVHAPPHGEAVRPHDRGGRDEPGEDQAGAPGGEGAPVALGETVVDGPGEEVGQDREAAEGDRGAHERRRGEPAAAGGDPEEVAPGLRGRRGRGGARRAVAGEGVVEREFGSAEEPHLTTVK